LSWISSAKPCNNPIYGTFNEKLFQHGENPLDFSDFQDDNIGPTLFLPIFTNIFLHPEDLMARDLLQSRCTDAMGQTEWRDSAIVEAGMRHPPLT